MRVALGLAAGGDGDRFLLGAGVLSLLVEAAAPDGLVCVVDDLQWVDQAHDRGGHGAHLPPEVHEELTTAILAHTTE